MNNETLGMLQCANGREPGGRARRVMYAALTFCLLAALAMNPLAARAQEDLPGRVGRVADVAGELFLAPQDKPEQWTPIGVNYPVTNGDNLWVGPDGRAEIDFGAGQFRLAGNSSLHLSRLDDRQFALFVAQGRVQVRVRVLDPGETARIDTPNTQIVLTRPGSYRVDVSDDREHTQVIVREGEANVLTNAATQQVLPGQTATVDGTDPQYANVRNGIGTDGFDSWAANRDRRYQGGRAASYVSPQMVGVADLDDHGTWSQMPEYGAVWYPNNVAADWAPYRDGYWANVGTWGPTWVDAAPWGYAPFHYGRWAHIGGRWGWCPGAYVARPLWAPALVGWAGGSGWAISTTVGAPVYGWVPLAWGEPFRPWWGRCSAGCWDRYNRPYAVNVTVVRPNSPPPTRYVNWNAPGGITAMSGNAFVARQSVRGNLVSVPGGTAASAPVMVGAPMVRADPGHIPVRRPGDGTPPPASTFYPTTARTNSPGGLGSAVGTTAPGGLGSTVRTPSAVAPTTQQPRAMTAPASPPASMSRQVPSANPQAATPYPGGMGQAIAPAPRNVAPPTVQATPFQQPQGNAAAQAGALSRQTNRPVPDTQSQSVQVPPTGRATPATVQPVPVSPMSRTAPAPTQVAPIPMSPMGRSAPAPTQVSPAPVSPMGRAAPAPHPQVAAPQPAPQPVPTDGNSRKDNRGSNNPPGNDGRDGNPQGNNPQGNNPQGNSPQGNDRGSRSR